MLLPRETDETFISHEFTKYFFLIENKVFNEQFRPVSPLIRPPSALSLL